MVTVSLLALDKERTRHDGRAHSPLRSKGPWSRRHPTVTLSSCSASARWRPVRGEPGGNAGQHAPSPGLGSRAEESSGRGGARKARGRRGLAPLRHAHQVALGQVARARRSHCRHSSAVKPVPGPGLRPLPSALPTPLGPSPSLAKTLSGNQTLRARVPTGQLFQLDHSLPAWLCFQAGEDIGNAWINLGPGDVSVVRDPEEARSQALQEPATDWRERGAGTENTRQAAGRDTRTAAEGLGPQKPEKEVGRAEGQEDEAGVVAEDRSRPGKELASR